MDLNQALSEFDSAETTLKRLEAVWGRLSGLVPSGTAFVGETPAGIEYEDLCRAYRDLVGGLPKIDGYHINCFPLPLDGIAQDRLDAQEIGEFDALIAVEAAVAAPGEAIREYRFRFNRERRRIARDRILELIAEVDDALDSLKRWVEPNRDDLVDPRWDQLREAVREVDRLAGSFTPRTGRWPELLRHVAWGQGIDLHDIANLDWPSVRANLQEGLYAETEPMPTQVADLAELAASRPAGHVTTSLRWDVLDDEDFERLIFDLISNASEYENPRWLTKTHAPDRGRDLSVERVYRDALSGVRRERVIISCKHWLSKAVGPDEVNAAVARVPLSEPPAVHALVIATSGRFTADAVELIDKQNAAGIRPFIDPWPESHLESLLARRPDLVPVGLRPLDES